MTIAEKLYRSEPKILFEIIVTYQLEDLARLYFPDKIIPTQQIEDDENNQEYARLMKPCSYSGRVERRNGAITQRHRGPLK